MRIGIDARLIGETGVGRYIKNLLAGIASYDRKNEYVIFLGAKAFDGFALPNARWKKVLSVPRWHTVAEQLVMPGLFADASLDLLHVPYHNPPVLYGERMIITIHDLTILHFSTGKATTLPMPLYYLKRMGYAFELGVGLAKAKKIIAVSHATKREIIDHFRVPPEKIAVTYEGVDRAISAPAKTSPKSPIDVPYFLYVGNAYPHKNLERLISAFAEVSKTDAGKGTKLVLVGNDDFFYRRLRGLVAEKSLSHRVVFYGPANDTELAALYGNAISFVFPSLMEGFGLPALEALASGCPVIASDIAVFHEILGEHASYADPRSIRALAEKMIGMRKREKRTPDPKALATLLKQYSWDALARETITLYESSAGI